MDKALDEIVRERQSSKNRTSRRNPRGGVRKVREMPAAPFPELEIRPVANAGVFLGVLTTILLSSDSVDTPATNCDRSDEQPRDNTRSGGAYDESRLWVHDKFDNDNDGRRRQSSGRRGDGHSSDRADHAIHAGVPQSGARLKIENLHYELGEEELMGLFRRIGPVTKLNLLYDRAGRSEGVAFVTYEVAADAHRAIEEFDGANAHGQPITLTLVSRGGRAPQSSSTTTAGPDGARSLFDRIRTASPSDTDRSKRDPTRKPTPPGIDRYVPPERRRNAPARERDDGRRPPRSNSAPGRSGRQPRSGNGVSTGNRPRKTIEELDAEMNDYFGAANEEQQPAPAVAPVQEPVHQVDEDGDIVL
ncbi:hypothetical protein EX30DRAFT_398246 [Ascodesmis nigricans]|uniref:RRM domain-containing protein n=1 Tax=Ascodesmis nigricans TaxID=341454 RepID=A0A4S2MLD0_9PEZI|nr:hypothetical protein EX30DRAFT_398246 [Ascodesmis nigricans]